MNQRVQLNCNTTHESKFSSAFCFGLFGIIAIGTLSSCGTDKTRETANVESQLSQIILENKSISFQDWCLNWKLNCTEPTPSQPHDVKLTPAAWNALNTVLKQFLIEMSKIQFSAAELQDPEFQKIMHAMGLPKTLSQLLNMTQKLGLEKIQSTTAGILNLTLAKKTTTLESRSGLRWNFGQNYSVEPTVGSGIKSSGLTFSSPDGQIVEEFKNSNLSQDSTIEWNTSNLKILNIPQNFIENEFFSAQDELEKLNLNSVLPNIANLMQWAFAKGRKLDLSPAFFEVLSAQAKILIQEPSLAKIVAELTKNLGSLSIQMSPTKPTVSMRTKSNKTLFCRMEVAGVPNMDIEFASEFGVQKMYGVNLENQENNVSKPALNVTMYGLKSKIDLPGPFDPTFSMEEVEIQADHIIIKKVPVIGQISVPFSLDHIPEIKNFACRNSLED